MTLGLSLEDRVPDAKTIWLYHEHLTEAQLIETLFVRFDVYLKEKGFAARKGQIIDASITAAPRQRNTREENAIIKRRRDTPGVGESSRQAAPEGRGRAED